MLFAFPSRYWFTIGRQRVFSLGEWSPQFPTRLHVSRSTQDTASSLVRFRLRDCHTLWPRFPSGSPTVQIGNSTHAVLQPPSASTWVWAVPISLAATFGISVIYFPPGTEMVHFPGLAHTRLCIQRAVTRVHLAGFLHSEIPGSKPACGSPRLIAACHVLHRLLAPRHPPYALSSLIIKLTQYVVCQGVPFACANWCSPRWLYRNFRLARSPCFLQPHLSAVRLPGAATIDATDPQVLD